MWAGTCPLAETHVKRLDSYRRTTSSSACTAHSRDQQTMRWTGRTCERNQVGAVRAATAVRHLRDNQLSEMSIANSLIHHVSLPSLREKHPACHRSRPTRRCSIDCEYITTPDRRLGTAEASQRAGMVPRSGTCSYSIRCSGRSLKSIFVTSTSIHDVRPRLHSIRAG